MIEHAAKIKDRVDELMKAAAFGGGSTVEPNNEGGVTVQYDFGNGRFGAVQYGCVAGHKTTRTWEDFATKCAHGFMRVGRYGADFVNYADAPTETPNV